jgi:replicative DNA helicase
MIGEREDYEKNLIKKCFEDNDVFLQCIDKVPNEKLFKNNMTRLFWQIFTMIFREGEKLHMSVVHDILKQTKNDEIIPVFEECVNGSYPDEDQWDYHLGYLIEQYKKEKLLEISEEIRKNIGSKSSEELLVDTNAALIDLNSSEVSAKSFKSSFHEEVKNIRNIAKGTVVSLLKTGHKQIDDLISFGKKQIILIAAQKKQGKTRFLVHLIDRLVQWNKQDIAVQWYSFEMQADEMTRLYISKRMGLTDKQLQGINYTLTEDELDRIEATSAHFSDYPVEFVDETLDIFKICSKFERFADGHKGKTPVLVIDNLGLVKPHLKNEVQNDDDVSRMIKDLRDKTGALIILLHHLSKESEGKFNVTEMYAPKVTHIRGSSRIADFANKVLLLHRPEMYRDVVKHFEKDGKLDMIMGRMEVNCALNRNGDTGIIDLRHQIEYCNFTDW